MDMFTCSRLRLGLTAIMVASLLLGVSMVAHPPIASAGSMPGSIVPSPNQTWSIVTSPNTSTTQANTLIAMSCTSASFCMAAGYYCTSSC